MYTTYVRPKIISSGIYNLGSGNPISHYEVAELVVKVMQEEKVIPKKPISEYVRLIPFPEELRGRFQFFTKAEDVPTFIRDMTMNNKRKMEEYLKTLCREEE